MHLHLNRTIVCFALLLLMSFASVSCSKDDPEITHYQLEGTWQLYKSHDADKDSTYELSADNQIIFTPKFYWNYTDAALSDSGTYVLTDINDSAASFSAKITLANNHYDYLSLYGDTLNLVFHGFLIDSLTYIKVDQPVAE